MLAINPHNMAGILNRMEANEESSLTLPDPGSIQRAMIQAENPVTIDVIAPMLFARSQYSPAINGTNKETRLKADDSETNS